MNKKYHIAFSKWHIDFEFGGYKDINKLIQFELENFSDWEFDVEVRSEKLKKNKLLEKSKKCALSEYEQDILDMNEFDLLNAKDEDIISFQAEVIEIIIIKLYAKTEYLSKYFFTMLEDKNGTGKVKLGGDIREWKDNYISRLSVNLELVCNYQVFNTLRILNNNIK